MGWGGGGGRDAICLLQEGKLNPVSSQCALWLAEDPRFLHADSED